MRTVSNPVGVFVSDHPAMEYLLTSNVLELKDGESGDLFVDASFPLEVQRLRLPHQNRESLVICDLPRIGNRTLEVAPDQTEGFSFWFPKRDRLMPGQRLVLKISCRLPGPRTRLGRLRRKECRTKETRFSMGVFCGDVLSPDDSSAFGGFRSWP